MLCQKEVADEQAERPAGSQGQTRGNVQEGPGVSNALPDEADQLVKREGIRADHIHNPIYFRVDILSGNFCQVIHINRLDLILAIPNLGEERKAPQEPGDVIDQDILDPEDQGRAKDGIRDF